jgi:DNA-binding LytR/AlgR family response regulator
LRVGAWILGAPFYSTVHVAIMVALRMLLFPRLAIHYHYSFNLRAEWLYEFRKDAIAYAVALIGFGMATRRGAETEARREVEPRPGRVLLADGRAEVELDAAALAAMSAAGNYVEAIFVDGRRRLLRNTLADAEQALAPFGFTRTHKSWLVRLDLVERRERTAGGDYLLHLPAGVKASLSRRRTSLLRGRTAAG